MYISYGLLWAITFSTSRFFSHCKSIFQRLL
uniref:Uncharacterized protein n=1 Tax=Rhizophora mucronata TaxID=61149 RepID=A0A2P2M3D5_RHIMU